MPFFLKQHHALFQSWAEHWVTWFIWSPDGSSYWIVASIHTSHNNNFLAMFLIDLFATELYRWWSSPCCGLSCHSYYRSAWLCSGVWLPCILCVISLKKITGLTVAWPSCRFVDTLSQLSCRCLMCQFVYVVLSTVFLLFYCWRQISVPSPHYAEIFARGDTMLDLGLHTCSTT